MNPYEAIFKALMIVFGSVGLAVLISILILRIKK